MSEIDLGPKSSLLQWNEEDVTSILKQYDRKLGDLKADVAVIRNWLRTQPHLPLQPSDRKIVFFLILCKFSFENTKTKLEMNYTIKSILPEYYSINPRDPRIEECMKSYYTFALPRLSSKGNRILISKCQNPDTFNLFHLYNYVALFFELRATFDISNSDDLIMDCENINLTLISKVNIVEIKKLVSVWEKVYAARVGAIHVIRLPKIAETIANMILSLLKDKIRKKVHFHNTVEGLWEFYEKDLLPKEMGGSKPLEEINRDWLEFLRENNDYLEENQKARIVENLRLQKLENDEILGYHGNFRKLAID